LGGREGEIFGCEADWVFGCEVDWVFRCSDGSRDIICSGESKDFINSEAKELEPVLIGGGAGGAVLRSGGDSPGEIVDGFASTCRIFVTLEVNVGVGIAGGSDFNFGGEA
jgi:hypothetical protein